MDQSDETLRNRVKLVKSNSAFWSRKTSRLVGT